MDFKDMKPKYYESEEEALEVKRNSSEWYLYHHIKNEDALIPVIIFSFLGLFINGGSLLFFIIWGWYISYCYKNNRELDNDPYIQKKREIWKQEKLKYVRKK